MVNEYFARDWHDILYMYIGKVMALIFDEQWLKM